MNDPQFCSSRARSGFSMVEVVLAIGIFLVTVLALVGLLGPTLTSVEDVEKTDEVSSVVNTVNAFLQSSPDIAPGGSKFNAVYDAVGNGGEATLFVYRWYDATTDSADNPIIRLEVGFSSSESSYVGADSVVNAGSADFSAAAGPIYRVVLTPSSVIPDAHVTDNGEGTYPRYTLNKTVAQYPEGYLAMEVRIFAEVPPAPGQTFNTATTLADLVNREPIFTYNTAIVR